MFILQMKALKPRCLRHSSAKKTQEALFCQKKTERIELMEIVFFNITDYLHSVLTIIKPREFAGMGCIHM